MGAWTRTEKQIYSDMNVGHGRPRFQNIKQISYRSTSCNFFKCLSLASLDYRMSKYLDKNNSVWLSRRFRCAYFHCHFLLKLSKQREVVLQFAHSNCCHRRWNGSIDGESTDTRQNATDMSVDTWSPLDRHSINTRLICRPRIDRALTDMSADSISRYSAGTTFSTHDPRKDGS